MVSVPMTGLADQQESLSEMGAITLPFHEMFEGSKIGEAWTAVVSEGNSLSIENNSLRIEATAHASAHLQRPLGEDLITVTAKIWGAAFYLVWNAENGCGMGRVSPTPFPRFFISQTIQGTTRESHLVGCSISIPYYLRFQIASDCFRFSYSEDDKEWRHLKTIPRPDSLAGAPSLMVFGNYYGEDDVLPFGDVAMSPDGDRGSKYTCFVGEIRIEKTPEDALLMTSAEKRAIETEGLDPVAQVVLRGSEDPTYESVEAFYPPFKFPREVVGVPEHPLDIGIDYQGRLDVSPWDRPYAWIEIGDPLKPFGDTPIARRLQKGYLPIVTLSTERDDIRYEMAVFGWSEDFRVDKDLFAYVRLRARTSKSGQEVKPIALVDARSGARTEWPLLKIGRRDYEVCLSFKYPEPSSAQRVSSSAFERISRNVTAHWEKRLEIAKRVRVPDQRMNEAYKAWIVYSLLNADTVNGYVEARDGSGFYDEMFGYSVSLHTMAADLFGMHNYAERCLQTQLHFQAEDGMYVQATGLPDLGSLLMALYEHYLVTRDVAWLQSVAPNIDKGCQWILQQRQATPKEGITKGMIKFRPYCDYPVPVYNFMADIYACMGLERGAEALQVLGMRSEAERYAAEADAYRNDLLAAMDAAAFQDGDLKILPMEPETRRLLKLDQYQGGGYYGLVCGILLETGFLTPDDVRSHWITDIMERRNGLIGGVCEFQLGVDHAYTYGYLMTKMQRDNIRNVILGLWGMMAFGMTRDTYSPVEVNMIQTGDNHLTLPHLYSCTQQLRLLRNMLLCEEGDVLWIGRAIPRVWLEPDKRVEVKSAPTHFGEVSYSIDAKRNGNMVVRISPPQRQKPSEIRVRLRHPRQLPIRKVKISPQTPVELSGETLVLKQVDRKMRINVCY